MNKVFRLFIGASLLFYPVLRAQEAQPQVQQEPQESQEQPEQDTQAQAPAQDATPAQTDESQPDELPQEETPAAQEPQAVAPSTEDSSEQEPAQEAAEQEIPEETPVVEEEPIDEIPAEEEFVEEAPAEEEIIEVMPLGPDEIMGIDTVDLEDPQGNWLYKRVWWERAEGKYEKIRAEVGRIMETRTTFFASRADLDKNVLDPFYVKIGLSQGELIEILKGSIEKLEKSITTEKNEELLERAQEDKRELEKLQTEVQNVMRLDEDLENAVMTLVNQISKLRAVEQQAWQDFKSISRVLDDRKARELFYKVENGWRNVQELSQYIQGSFSTSFNQLIERIKTSITMVDGAVATLKQKGVELKMRMQEPVAEEEEAEEEAPKGFFTRYIIDPVKSVFTGIWSIIRWPYDAVMRLFGYGPAVEPDEEDTESEAVEAEEEEAVQEQAVIAEPMTAQQPAYAAVSTEVEPEQMTAPEEPIVERQEYEVEEDDDDFGQAFQAEEDEDFGMSEQLQESTDLEE